MDDGLGGRCFPNGREARRWLRRRILDSLFTSSHAGIFVPYGTDYAWRPSLVRRVLDWYEAQRPDRYVSWHDEVEWAGRGFKSGSWRLDVEAVVADFPRATDALDRELDARECEILEDWLRKDLAGDLFYRGHPGGTSKILPHERRAFLTAKEARDRLRFDADARK